MPFKPGHLIRPRQRHPSELTYAAGIQRLAAETALSLKAEEGKPLSLDSRMKLAKALRDAVSAWDTARDAVRVLRGKGLPRAVLETPRKKSRSVAGPAMMIEDDEPTTNPQPTTQGRLGDCKGADREPVNSKVHGQGEAQTCPVSEVDRRQEQGKLDAPCQEPGQPEEE